MSDKHDHSHQHHDHDHDHDHDHHHNHDAPTQPAPAMPEDAGSQALAEALKSSFAIVKVVMFFLLIVFLCSGFFTVGSQQKAMVLRFGKPVGEGNRALLTAGLHWGFPPPIDEVVRIPITEIQQVTSTVGWYFTTKEMEVNNMEPPAGPSLNPAQDGYTITADGNIIHTRATLYYRIEEPIQYTFDFVNASNTVQSALDNALIYASLRYKVDDALTRDITGFKETVQARVTELVAKQKLGIVVDQCQVESRPPRQLRQAFDQVLTALSTRDKVRNDALSYQNQVLSRASAEASSRTNAAQAERVRLVESVKAEAQRFNDLLPKYQANPALFANILLSEKIGQVLTNMQDKVYLPEQTRELRLQLSREPQKPAAQQSSPNQ
ncbi:protease modulator HflK [Pedosphaera parvula]|uniref:Band 7 protein n=1 Tax=Pedosphaera parvula (strain Ellin514) TaxID=320771 RepID=B9XHB6_PEDPL|nr:protease modulator HflK [Pedosphaera parvula]EEF60751.1 band 7 protein [Pedosphaera parvula Ellin514]